MDKVWARLNDLFDRLADASPVERAIILEAETRGAPRLRRRLTMMLAAHDIGSDDVDRAVQQAFETLDRQSISSGPHPSRARAEAN